MLKKASGRDDDSGADWAQTMRGQLASAVAAARAAARLPAYRRAFRAAGVEAAAISADTWGSLPFLTKDDLIRGAQDNPPFGDRLGVARGDLAHVFAAPGPIYMPYTAGDMAHVAGSFARAMRSCGLEPGDLVDQTTMYNWVIAATVIDRALGMIGCGVVPGGIGQSERHLEVIRHLGVDAIVAFPTFLEHLLDRAEAEGRPLGLKKAVVMGELSHPDTKRRLHDTYGLEAREFYGVSDVGAVAWECTHGAGMHLRDDLLVEFIAPGGTTPVDPSPETPAELVVTDFHRKAMPIIRLRTGDMIDGLIRSPCACGSHAPRFTRIAGRAGEITKVKGMFVVPRLVGDVFLRHGIDRRYRLVVDRTEGGRDALTLEIEGAPLADAAGVQAGVEAALRMKLDMAFVDTLPEQGLRLLDRRNEGRPA
ncbi:phenylacetate--CoA ligase family protein [Ruixingdingia sedimenti]|uniref:Phenylacetate-CoA ligase n=1 Tax=Ruixingdingia sedimenti TaxID=3073604 RepID=A0ABU1FE21_9RHOB|nr:hypothetical protein [Xinfangfangia sp. LG-4]MDR5654714.1 hypothetical protein [Xinfangfangia sp. LG-4]